MSLTVSSACMRPRMGADSCGLQTSCSRQSASFSECMPRQRGARAGFFAAAQFPGIAELQLRRRRRRLPQSCLKLMALADPKTGARILGQGRCRRRGHCVPHVLIRLGSFEPQSKPKGRGGTWSLLSPSGCGRRSCSRRGSSCGSLETSSRRLPWSCAPVAKLTWIISVVPPVVPLAALPAARAGGLDGGRRRPCAARSHRVERLRRELYNAHCRVGVLNHHGPPRRRGALPGRGPGSRGAGLPKCRWETAEERAFVEAEAQALRCWRPTVSLPSPLLRR